MRRATAVADVRQAWSADGPWPPGEYDEAGARLPRLSLLWQLRSGLRHRLVLLFRGSPVAVRPEDRQARDPIECRGRPHSGQRQGPRRGRPVFRSSDGRRAPRVREGRRDGRERGRYDPHPAQLEVHAIPQRDRQRIRRDRTLSLRADSRPRQRISPEARRQRLPAGSRHWRRAHLHAPLHQRAQGPAVPARIPDAVLE